MSYEESLKAAGAEVLVFEEFGSYQGSWYAKVKYEDKLCWISGSFGSCSGCDAFQSEFGDIDEECTIHRYFYSKDNEVIKNSCEFCIEAKKVYNKRLAEFGKDYLDNILTYEQALAEASENIDWDSDAAAMVKFIEDNK